MSRVRFLLLTSIAVLIPSAAAAQEGLLGLPEQSQEAPAEPSTAPSPPAELANARATVDTFLSSFGASVEELDGRNPLEVAVACLDLDSLPSAARRASGHELAIRLKQVIDKVAWVDLDEVPAASDGPPWVFYRGPQGEIVVARDEDGVWRFTSGTVASIAELEATFADRETVAGVNAPPKTLALAVRDQMPPRLRREVVGLELWQWLGLAVLALGAVVLDRVVVTIGNHVLAVLLARRALVVKAEERRRGLRPAGMLAAATLWLVGLRLLALPPHTLAVLLLAARVVVASAFVWTAWRFVDIAHAALAERASRTSNRFDDLLVPLLTRSLKVLVAVAGVVVVAETFDLKISGLLAGLGIGGVAVALASKDTVENLFGSFTVVLDRPFHVGDWVVIGAVEGTVEEVGFRSTRVRTFYNSLVTVPNAALIRASVDNYGARRWRRWRTVLSVAYETPADRLEAFCAGIKALIKDRPTMRRDGNFVVLNDFGESSLDILLYVFFDVPDWATELDERHRLGVDIIRLARELGVEFAFPTRTLFVRRGAATEPIPEALDWSLEAEQARHRGVEVAQRLAPLDQRS